MATVKQKLAIRKVLKGTTLKRAMKEAGYKTSTTLTTGKLTRSKGWALLMDRYISDKALAKVHKEGLAATTFYTEGIGKGETVLVEKPDYSVRHKYLESGYKIKGKLKELEVPTPTVPHMTLIQINMPDGAKSNTIQPVA